MPPAQVRVSVAAAGQRPGVVGRTQRAVCTEGQLGFSGIEECLKRAGCGFHSTVIQVLLECLQFTLGRSIPRLSHLPWGASRNPHMCSGLGGGAVTAQGCCEDIYFLPERRLSSGTELPRCLFPSRPAAQLCFLINAFCLAGCHLWK